MVKKAQGQRHKGQSGFVTGVLAFCLVPFVFGLFMAQVARYS